MAVEIQLELVVHRAENRSLYLSVGVGYLLVRLHTDLVRLVGHCYDSLLKKAACCNQRQMEDDCMQHWTAVGPGSAKSAGYTCLDVDLLLVVDPEKRIVPYLLPAFDPTCFRRYSLDILER